MKLHDPATERELLRIATRARNGKPAEPSDPRKGGEKIGQLLSLLVVLYLTAAVLGALDERLRTEHWRYLICSVLLLWVAQVGLGQLIGGVDRYRAVLVNLPISGEHVLRWARSRFFIQKWFLILCFSVLCSLSLSNFSWASPWQLATTTLLLFATTVVTVILLDDSWLGRLRIVKIWTIVSLLLIGWMTVLFFTHRRIFRIGGTPEWMADGIQNITWLFPPSWSLPGRLEQGGVYLAALWIGIGAMRWLAWPKLSAPHFDAPQDFVETFGDFAYQEDDDGEFGGRDPKPAAGEIDHLAVAVDAEPKAVKTNRHIRIPKPLAMAAGGWVDRLIRRVVGESNAALAGALADPSHTSTRKTNRVIVWSPVWLAVTWTITEFYPESDSKELIIFSTWILSPALLILGLLPFSNAIPRATAAWNLGSQSMPFFTAGPVGTRDLLRLSMRITLARCIVMALIATPLCWLLLVILAPEDTPWVACWLVPAFCFFWATSRPLLVWYRLQAATRRRRGALLSHALGVSLSIALAIVWLVSGAGGVLSGLGYFLGGASGSDRWLLPALAVGGLFLSGLTARAVFEIHRWQLSRRHFDWVSSE